jgi:hypothetical protein
MKKILFMLALAAGAAALFAQEFTISGEMKTGVLWREFDDGLEYRTVTKVGDDGKPVVIDGVTQTELVPNENQVTTRMGS